MITIEDDELKKIIEDLEFSQSSLCFDPGNNIKEVIVYLKSLESSSNPSLSGEALEKAFDFGKNYTVTRTTQPFVVLTSDDIDLLAASLENSSTIIGYFKSKLP